MRYAQRIAFLCYAQCYTAMLCAMRRFFSLCYAQHSSIAFCIEKSPLFSQKKQSKNHRFLYTKRYAAMLCAMRRFFRYTMHSIERYRCIEAIVHSIDIPYLPGKEQGNALKRNRFVDEPPRRNRVVRSWSDTQGRKARAIRPCIIQIQWGPCNIHGSFTFGTNVESFKTKIFQYLRSAVME